MQFKAPKNDDKYSWTNHVLDKMRYYGISESLIKRVVRNPNRVEEGVAPKTNASMQARKVSSHKNGKPQKWDEEVWVMWQELKARDSDLVSKGEGKLSGYRIQDTSSKKRIISAWRYPGMSPKRGQIPIPDDVLLDIENALE